jgi:rhomboid protease GluP
MDNNSIPNQTISSAEPVPPQPQPVPVKVTQPGKPPFVTYIILGVTVLAFFGQLLGPQLFGSDFFLWWGEKENSLINQGQVWRFFTPMLLHGSVLHILFNMYALIVLGLQLEIYYGHKRFFLLYIMAGFAGNVFSYVLTPSDSIGASTALFGLVAAQGVFIYRNKKLFGQQGMRMLRQVILVVIINMFIGVATPMVDIWGHVGGLIGGAMFAWVAGPLWEVRPNMDHLEVFDLKTSRDGWMATALVLVVFSILAIAAHILL